MNANDRINVIWIGGKPPEELKNQLEVRSLLLVEGDEVSLAAQVNSSRAVVVEFAGDLALFLGRSRRVKREILSHGCLLALVRHQNASAIDYVRATEVFTKANDEEWYGPQERPKKPIQVFQTDWSRIAQHISEWYPGPSENEHQVSTANDLPQDRALLLRRAFWDFPRLVTKKLSGGLSGAVVYQVTPRGTNNASGQTSLPYLAKFDEPRRIAEEHDKYEKFVRFTVPFNHRPNVISGRTVYGPTSAILVEDFMDRALPMETLIRRSNASALVASVFDGALQHWRRSAVLQTQQLASHTLFAKILNPKPQSADCLVTACNLARTKWTTTLPAPDLIARLLNVRPINCHWSTVHGDLHMGNLFVTSTSNDVVMIDFYRSSYGPSVIDPACFEVDVLFRRTSRLDPRFVLGLYTEPIGIPFPGTCTEGREWLWDCVRAIRGFGATTDSAAYTYALAVFLLSFASYENNKTPTQRALAIRICSELAMRLN